MEALYGTHPYAKPASGTEESISAITRENVVGFYKQYYVANNAMVAIVGDVDRKQAETIAEDIVSGLAAGEKAATLPSVDPLQKGGFEFLLNILLHKHIFWLVNRDCVAVIQITFLFMLGTMC